MIKINKLKIENTRFPNGEIKLNEEQIREGAERYRRDALIEFYYRGDESLLELYLVVKYIQDIYENKVVCIYFVYLPYSRQDRQVELSAFTLKYITDWINSWGVLSVNIGEPHSDVGIALVSGVRESLTEDLFNDIKNAIGFDVDKDVLFFPDAGAQKRYSSLKAPHLVGFKHRDWETGEIASLEVCGKVPEAGFTAVIVDDLCSFGGTFLHSARKLKELGAGKIYLIVAHCENNILKGELLDSGLIERVYTTNSIFTEEHDLITVKEI